MNFEISYNTTIRNSFCRNKKKSQRQGKHLSDRCGILFRIFQRLLMVEEFLLMI